MHDHSQKASDTRALDQIQKHGCDLSQDDLIMQTLSE
jgi:hypothetical protein